MNFLASIHLCNWGVFQFSFSLIINDMSLVSFYFILFLFGHPSLAMNSLTVVWFYARPFEQPVPSFFTNKSIVFTIFGCSQLLTWLGTVDKVTSKRFSSFNFEALPVTPSKETGFPTPSPSTTTSSTHNLFTHSALETYSGYCLIHPGPHWQHRDQLESLLIAKA